jgi:hypothetical protein
MDNLPEQFTIRVQAVITFPVEANSPEAALKTWLAWQLRYHGQIPAAGAATAALDLDTAAAVQKISRGPSLTQSSKSATIALGGSKS